MSGKKRILAAALVLLLAVVSGTVWYISAGRREKRAEAEAETDKAWYELGMMSDDVLDEVLLFYLGEAWQGLSDINECLETVHRVDPDDPESWSREWKKTAERLERTGYEKLKEGHQWSAGEYLLRASTYYRASMHRNMFPGSDEVKAMTEREVQCFITSQEMLKVPMEVVRVPFEGIELTGYFYTADAAAMHGGEDRTGGSVGGGEGLPDSTPAPKAPTLIVHQGRDAWAEDCVYIAREAARRGYHCLLIDGPGNGQVLRRYDLSFRPDWETFVSPVVDFLLTRPEVDQEGIILMGISMGGYLAGRAAAFEPRLRICITNPGVLDWGEVLFEKLNEYSPEILEMYEKHPKRLNGILKVAGALNPFLLWGIADTMWKHGADTPVGLMDDMQRYTNRRYAENITASTLVIDAEYEAYGQSRLFYDSLTCEKDYMLFTEEEAAPLHVQVGSLAVSSQRIFDWIDTEMGRQRLRL